VKDHWQARSRSSPAVRAASAPRSPGASPRTAPASPSPTPKARTQRRPLSKRLNAAAERRSRSRRTRPTPMPSGTPSNGRSQRLAGSTPYAATKGAVKMFTQGLARELGARGITVNNVQPGPIDTDLNPASGEWAAGQKAAVPLDRYGHADEVAALVAFVAGPESSYINGANLTVDGGTNA